MSGRARHPRAKAVGGPAQRRVLEAVRNVLPLALLGTALVYTNATLTFTDRETAAVRVAAQPVSQILALFRSGQITHPPLFELLMHSWLRATGGALSWLRIPSILFFLTGVLLLSRTGRRLANAQSAMALLWLAALWPYGFHYGRVAAWYPLCFLLISALTWAYFRCCAAPSRAAWLAICAAGLALIYTTYFGWAIILLLGIDYVVKIWGAGDNAPPARSHRGLLATGAVFAIGYAPIWPYFARALFRVAHPQHPAKLVALNAGYKLYVMFVSESVAPWFWRFGVPAAVAVAVCLVVVFAGARWQSRRLLAYAALLIVIMAIAGTLSTYALLFVAPWILLPIAIAIGTGEPAYLRTVAAVALIVVAAAGWFGMSSRRYYANPRFFEPWPGLAAQTADALQSGAGIIGNNSTYFFYLAYALNQPRRESHSQFLDSLWETPRGPSIWTAATWERAGRPLRGYMLWVRGLSASAEENQMDAAGDWLNHSCGDRIDRYLVRDPGYAWKQRLFPQIGGAFWLIEIRQYTCNAQGSAPATPAAPPATRLKPAPKSR